MPKSQPWDQPTLDADERRAFQALRKGIASEGQQKIVLNVLLLKFARTHANPFQGGANGELATAFACGKMFVGQRIINAIEGLIPDEKPKDRS